MDRKESYIDAILESKEKLRVYIIKKNVFRVRHYGNNDSKESSLIRYGIVKSDWEGVEYTVKDNTESFVISTDEASIEINKNSGSVNLYDKEMRVLTRNAGPLLSAKTGFSIDFDLGKDEKIYGLGDETRERLQKRGYKANMWVQNVDSYVPIPFIMSNKHWAMYLNTTWRHQFDIGCSDNDLMKIWASGGELDYYLIVGQGFAELLNSYTDITGKPVLLPLHAYGLTFVCNEQADAREMLEDCLNLRREGIPCDIIGLEPGWMETYYDYTNNKKWHPKKFYIPEWVQKDNGTFMGAAGNMGFKLSLWLCCDYDLSYFEEQQSHKCAQEDQDAGMNTIAANIDAFEQDKNFELTKIFIDNITKRNEGWFEHLKKFVDQGASAFKLDGARQVLEHPDRKWGNGMDDEEMHNLYPLLLNKQMSLGFKEYTGRRSMIYSSGGYAGIQQYSATWAGDTGGGPKPLVSLLNHGMSGHTNTSCDMEVFTPAGIHFGFLQPWSQVCSWAYWRHPWLLGDKLLPIFKFYAQLRYELIPYIYSMAHAAAQTGMPIMRAMPLVFPDDEASDGLNNQYMFGDCFLVNAFSDKVHLPTGKWIDYWTGNTYEGIMDIDYTIPEGKGGALFVRAGSIIPTWPVMDYIMQKEISGIGLNIYPCGTSEFTIYEDDGITYNYLDGQVVKTTITCNATESRIRININKRSGYYEGMVSSRAYDLWIYVDTEPKVVTLNGIYITKGKFEGCWQYDSCKKAVILKAVEEIERNSIEVVLS